MKNTIKYYGEEENTTTENKTIALIASKIPYLGTIEITSHFNCYETGRTTSFSFEGEDLVEFENKGKTGDINTIIINRFNENVSEESIKELYKNLSEEFLNIGGMGI